MPAEKKFAVIDGQHRLQAANNRGDIESLACVVIKEMDFVKQAKSFVAINSKRVQLNTLAAFHAAVASDDAGAVEVKTLLDECGIEIPRAPVLKDVSSPRQLQSPGTLVKLLEKYDRQHIVFALTLIPEAYGEEKGMLRSSLIKALTQFSAEHDDIDRARLLKVLGGIEPLQLEADARAYMGIEGGTSTDAMLQVLERQYRLAGRKGAAA